MLRFLPIAVELALLVYCLIDCIRTDSLVVRNLSKTWWVLLIIFVPLVGGIAWLVAGRPERAHRAHTVAWPSTATAGFPEYERPRPQGPDDDPAFLAGLERVDDEQADLRRREDPSRTQDGTEPDDPAAAPRG